MAWKRAKRYDDGRIKPNVFSGLVVTLLALVAIGYSVTALMLGDPAWFLPPEVDVPPERIIVYEAGTRHEIRPGDDMYEPLAQSIADALRTTIGFEETTGLSEISQQDAYERFVSVEAWYPKPLELHMRFRVVAPTHILLPITGRHVNKAFLGTEKGYTAGALVLDPTRTERIRTLLRAMGIQVDS